MNSNTYKDFIALVKKHLEGHELNPDFKIPVRIGNHLLYAITFKPKEFEVAFGLFLHSKKFSRKTLIVTRNGFCDEETAGILPATDLSESEPDFTGFTNQQIVDIVIAEVTAVLTNKKLHVHHAEHYKSCTMSSVGNARNMLIKQYNFPFTFVQQVDEISSAYLDRLKDWHGRDAIDCMEKYGLKGMGPFDYELRRMDDETAMNFLCEIMKADHKKYTGYRIMGGVADNGHDYYCFQLFYKDPSTNTEVFSGDDAPNVLPEKKKEFINVETIE